MRASYGEIKIEDILRDAGLNFKMEYIFPDLRSPNGRPLRFDFVVFDDDGKIDFIIEYQGKQHYEPSSKFGGKKGFYQQVYNDNLTATDLTSSTALEVFKFLTDTVFFSG